MEIRDGFIVGVFHYCDRWCEQCPLTSRCRMFSSLAEIDLEDRGESRLTRERRRLAVQLVEYQTEAEELRESAPTPGECVGHLPELEPTSGVDPEVEATGDGLRKKLRQLSMSFNPAVRNAVESIRYYSLFVPTKMMRALAQVARDGPGQRQSDANGSAKVAILALERMEGAWQVLIDTHHVSAKVAGPFLAEIAHMQRNLNRALPNAREFVRPGFDELEEVKMLDAAKC